jgi:UMF1 family MFS transporter
VHSSTDMQNSNLGQPNRSRIFVWTLFDFANTAFYVLILTVGYPLYFKEIIAKGQHNGDFLWGIAFSVSMLIVAIISPILGAVADYGAGKKRFLLIFTLLCVLATSGLYFTNEYTIALGMVLLIFANIGFEAGLVFYDAFLPEITTPRSYGRVSGYGFAMGYVGSLVTLLVAYPFYADGFSARNILNIRYSFLIAAAFFLIFSFPLFFFLKEANKTVGLKLSVIRIGFVRIKNTFKEFSNYKNTGKFLLSYFLYIDGINTIIIFSSIFARETLHLEIVDIIVFFALVQTSAIIGSVLFGILADHLGQKQSLSITLLLWLIIVVVAYFTTNKLLFYGLGLLAGIALGSSQSTSRSLMSTITPLEKKTEFFGFYSFFGKASAIIGPLIFGYISSMFNQRAAILSVGLLILAGLILLQRVEEKKIKTS